MKKHGPLESSARALWDGGIQQPQPATVRIALRPLNKAQITTATANNDNNSHHLGLPVLESGLDATHKPAINLRRGHAS